MFKIHHFLLLSCCIFLFGFASLEPANQIDSSKDQRFRPIGLATSPSLNKLAVADENGFIELINLNSFESQVRFRAAKQIGGISLFRGKQLLVADYLDKSIRCFDLSQTPQPVEIWQKPVCQYPTQILTSQKGSVAVAGKWSRQISILDFSNDNDSSSETIDLKFVPGKMIWMGESLCVADAHSNSIALVDLNEQSQPKITYREIPDRRIGAMVEHGQRVVFATQMLNPIARSTRNDVHWGLMVSNDVESFETKDLASDKFDYSKSRKLIPLGGAGEAKADPEQMLSDFSGRLMIALGGANQVALGNVDETGFAYIHVGARPVDLAQHQNTLFVANQLDGSVSVIDLEEMEVAKTIQLDRSQQEITLEEKGERLFYDARLSHDGWMSCHSCHVNGHTNNLVNDNLSDESFGTPKRVLSLLGHGGTEPLAWSGNNKSLADQIRKSILVTMQGDDRPTDEMIEAIGAFIKKLPAPPALVRSRGMENVESIEKGKLVFAELKCGNCHQAPMYTSADVYDVGLRDEKGVEEFNPPSLIGVGQRDLFMHDGRAQSIEEVFAKIGHQIPNTISDEKMSNLVAFLKSL